MTFFWRCGHRKKLRRKIKIFSVWLDDVLGESLLYLSRDVITIRHNIAKCPHSHRSALRINLVTECAVSENTREKSKAEVYLWAYRSGRLWNKKKIADMAPFGYLCPPPPPYLCNGITFVCFFPWIIGHKWRTVAENLILVGQK